MPQAHRKVDLGENSRMMAAGKYSDNTLRNVNVINGLEAQLSKVRLNVLQRNANESLHKMKTYEDKIKDLRVKTIAYQKVVANHPITAAPDYHKALDEKYTLHSFRHEIKDMLHKLHPDTIRKKKAQTLIEASRERYQAAIQSSQQYFNSLLPPKPLLKPHMRLDRKPEFRPSWHQEPVFEHKSHKDTNKHPVTATVSKQQPDGKNVQRKENHVRDAISNVQASNQAQYCNSRTRKVLAATSSDKKSTRLPEIGSQEENIKQWVNTLPNTHVRRRRRDTDDLSDTASKTSEFHQDGNNRFVSKTRILERYTNDPYSTSDEENCWNKDTTKKSDIRRRKPDKAKSLSKTTNRLENQVQEIRNDSGYGTAESDFEVTPRLKDGKEWKAMLSSTKTKE